MDETEITNNEYRQFVNWVRDSIAHTLLGEAGIEGHLIEEDREGNIVDNDVDHWNKQKQKFLNIINIESIANLSVRASGSPG